jgi:hypothetical protein
MLYNVLKMVILNRPTKRGQKKDIKAGHIDERERFKTGWG